MTENFSQRQQPLFLEDIFDALKNVVQNLGGAKRVGQLLWPHKPMDQAHKYLLDCLNRDNAHKFDAEEILALLKLSREAGYHQAKHWIDQATGYQPTPPSDPVVERDRLAEALDRASTTFEALTQAASQLIEREKRLKSVR